KSRLSSTTWPAMPYKKVAFSLFLFVLAAPAKAQDVGAGVFDEYGPNAAETFERDTQARWRFAIGGGLAADPNFQGSDKYRVHPTLFIFAGYGPFFIGFGGAGVNLYRAAGLRMGALVSLGQGRDESTDARLAGLGKGDRPGLPGLFPVDPTRSLSTQAMTYTDVGSEHRGS